MTASSASLPRREPINRRALGIALSQVADAGVHEALALLDGPGASDDGTWRCGITGPAGAGKSSLVARFANVRLDQSRRVGIVAIDPTSPISQGAILGDRIRIDARCNDDELFVRSLASRHAHNGLADNLANAIELLAQHQFDDIMIETVGAGQSQFEIRQLVDTLIIVLMPGAGDMVQAIKAGILECGDIYVINKADLPGAVELAQEIESVVSLRALDGADGWRPPVISASALNGDGIGEINDAAEAHRVWRARHIDAQQTRRTRLQSHIRALFERRLTEIIEKRPATDWDLPVAEAYEAVRRSLASPTQR